MRVLVADDERIARERLVRMLGRIAGVEVAGEAKDGLDALQKIAALRPDLVLLDIRMPGADGLEVVRRAPWLPHVVFTTAYEEYALAAFEAAAVDYLLKPIEEERLRRTIERVRRLAEPAPQARLEALLEALAAGAAGVASASPRRLTARRGDTTHLLDPREVGRIRAAGDYCAVRHGGREYLLDDTLAALEERLAPDGFVRVHRAELVNLHRVRALRRQDEGALLELEDGETATVSRRFLAALKERLGLP